MAEGIKLVKTMLLVFGFIGCAYQAISIVKLYLGFPYNVVVSIKVETNVTLPGITFCSNLGVQKSSLQDMEGFEDEMNELTDNDLDKQRLLDEYSLQFRRKTSIETLLDKTVSYSELVEANRIECACDDQTGGNFCSSYQDYIASFQKARDKCFTLFHATNEDQVKKGTANIDYSTTSVPMSREASVDDDEPTQVRLHPTELIRFRINFQTKNFVNSNKPLQATMLVHDNFMIPDMQRNQVIKLKPGYYYQIYIRSQKTVLLESPFDSKCRNYLHKVTGKKVHPILDTPSSRGDCMTGCLGQLTMDACKCWPPEFPYVSTVDTAHENNLTLCDWNANHSESDGSPIQERLGDFKHCVSRFTAECAVKCNNDCT
ncbi:hypothetical protein HDE_10328 [Halotydeus destructor]|nr:hypothetical protein HDE_10328 [Halotydeus destructor]